MNLRLFGGMLLLAAGTMLGSRMAERYSGHAKRLRLQRQLISAMITELSGTLPVIPELLRHTAAMPQFAPLRFLQHAAENADAFPQCWQDALDADSSLAEQERAVLETVGQTLGSTTLEGQIAALTLCAERLAALCSDAETLAKEKGTLCRSMGILGTLMLVILLL